MAWQLTKQTFKEWSDDKAPRLGATLSYYTVFSLAPVLILVISIAGLAPTPYAIAAPVQVAPTVASAR